MDIKLIASDLDGTLVREGQGYITDEDVEMILALKERGIIFAAASGRPYNCIRRTFAPIADDILYVCDNGCRIVWHDKELHLEAMDQALAFDLIDYINGLDDFCDSVACTKDDYVFIPKHIENAVSVARDWSLSIRIVESKELIVDDIIKFSAFSVKGISDELARRITEKWQGRVKHIAKSGCGWIDLQDGDKGSGIRAAAKALGISMENVAVFGDNFNDIELLDATPHSFAMSTAPDEVKKHAAFVCDSVQDTIKKLFLR